LRLCLAEVERVLREVHAKLANVTQGEFDELVARMKAGDQEVQGLIAQIIASGTKLDTSQVKTQVRWKLEKFEGEYSPEKTPFEVIEGED